jgi:hypothetical protein
MGLGTNLVANTQNNGYNKRWIEEVINKALISHTKSRWYQMMQIIGDIMKM